MQVTELDNKLVRFSLRSASLGLRPSGFDPTRRPDKSLTIGMLESWNDGILGSGKIGKCYNGEIHLDTEVKNALKIETSLKNNIPIFHHSMCVAKKNNASKIALNFSWLWNFRNV